MKIIIIGNGKVGYTLAEQLSKEEHDIIIIDRSEEALRRAEENLDVLCVKGNGMRGTVLKEAGVSGCDLIIASTSRDELNMVCCLTAKKLGAKYSVARIRDPEYARDITMIKKELDIDMVINPEQATAIEISRLLRFPGAINIERFVRGRVEMVGFTADEDDSLVGVKLASLRKRISSDVLFCALERDGMVVIPKGDTEFQPGDKVYVLGESMDITHFFKGLGRNTNRVRDAILVGGGRIARYLAALLIKMGIKVKIFEVDPDICVELTVEIPDAVVIHADGTDPELLGSENFRAADAFVTLTGRDEDNLMIALYALQSGIPRVVAKSNRLSYNSIVTGLGLDCVVSPKDITAEQIIHLARGMSETEGSVMETLYRILDGRLEVMEFTLSEDMPYLDIPLKELRLRRNVLIAVIVRNGRIIIPGGGDHLELLDSVIVTAGSELTVYQFSDLFIEE